MPTQSEQGAVSGWSPNPSQAKRSLFGNYETRGHGGDPEHDSDDDLRSEAAAHSEGQGPTLQEAINEALARSFLYRFLAQAFEDPTETGWNRLTNAESRALLRSAVDTLGTSAPALIRASQKLAAYAEDGGHENFLSAYLAAFGHAARGRCPLNEIEYGELRADPLFQPHRLADLAAFYRAFGLEVADDAGERQDHICLELEFMCVLAAKEAYALEQQLDVEDLAACRSAQKMFLREHLGRWTPAFARRLVQTVGYNALGALGELTGAFILAECERFHLAPGSEDLMLRPVDESAESLCGSCSHGKGEGAPKGVGGLT